MYTFWMCNYIVLNLIFVNNTLLVQGNTLKTNENYTTTTKIYNK